MKRATWIALCAGLMFGAGQGHTGEKEEGFTPLFNGKDLDGWHVMNGGKFSFKDGVIFLDKGSGWLRSDKEYGDFELRMEFRFVSKGADSGVFIRAGKDGKNWPAKAYQVQTMDNESIAGLFGGGKQKRDAALVKKTRKGTGEWQSYVITAKGAHVEVKLNDVVVNVVDGVDPKAGFIGMQGEGGQLEFKNIRVKELK